MTARFLHYGVWVIFVAAVAVGFYWAGQAQAAGRQGVYGPDRGEATSPGDLSNDVVLDDPERLVDGGLNDAPPKSNSHVEHFRIAKRNVKALLLDGETVWVGTTGGLIKYLPAQEKYRVYDNKSGLLSNGVFYVGRTGGELWVGTYGGGLSIFDIEGKSWRNYNIPNGLADAFVYDVLKTRSGDVWIATWSGANRIAGGDLDDVGNWRLYTVENTGGGLPNDWVYGLAEGQDGEIWLATEGGLARYSEGKWQNWNRANGLGAPYASVAEDIQFQNDPGEFSAHHARQKKEQGLEEVAVAYNPNYVVSLLVDRHGVVWAGTWGAGLSRFDGETWRTYTHRDGLPSNHVFALESDRFGNLLIGTSRGLAVFDGRRFAVFGRKAGLVSETVFAIADGDGSGTWVGSYGGVTWFPEGLASLEASR